MLFTSILFALFFLIVYIVYWSIPSNKYKHFWLLAASIVFYGSWSNYFLIHFLSVVFINYLFIKYLEKNKSKKILILNLVLNFLNLGLFKYFYFFTTIISDITGTPYIDQLKSSSFQIILPLAISFYTFQIVAYVVDVYKGRIKEETTILNFFIFILFFPQLIAGPIMRYEDFMPQLKNIKMKDGYFTKAFIFIASGIIKKVLLADNIAILIDPIWMSPEKYEWISLSFAAYGFAWQVYLDFSGYTDIAMGVAYLLGFEIPQNFKSPFLADSPKDLWNTWHVTLNSWMRDYLFIPLGGSRGGKVRTYINLIITFSVSGLWHGANWTYILWGTFHGIFLSLERFLEEQNIKITPSNLLGKIIRIIVTFHIFTIGLFFFRANKIGDSMIFFKNVFSFNTNGIKIAQFETLSYLFIIGFILQFIQYREKTPEFFNKYKLVLIPIAYIFILLFIGLYSSSGKEFVYFQF